MDFCWITIHVNDLSESLHFYQDIIGLTVTRKTSPNPDMQIVFLGSGKTEIELIHHAKHGNLSYGNDISLGFIVDSVDSELERLKRINIPVESGPFTPGPHIKFFYILDPNGIRIQLAEQSD